MIVPPIPWRCSAGIPASIRVRFAISPSTYDSVNFFEPITTLSAAEEEIIKKAGMEEKSRRKFGIQETRKQRKCLDPLDSRFPESNLSCFESLAVASHPLQASFVIRFIHSRCRVAR